MKQYVVANWKMYMDYETAHRTSKGMAQKIMEEEGLLPHVVICPSYPHLIPVSENLKGTNMSLGAQDCHVNREGAFTGEVSVAQIQDVKAEYVIIGHSERRAHCHETSTLIREKLQAVMAYDMTPILCVGESKTDRKQGKAIEKVVDQLKQELPDKSSPGNLMIAYEPLWCIGSDRTPSKEEIEEVHSAIRYELQHLQPNGSLLPLLYGGSVTPNNAATILGYKGVDGALLGRSSLKLDDLWAIVTAAKE